MHKIIRHAQRMQTKLGVLCRAGTIAIAGNLNGLQVANTGTGTIFTSGVASGASAAVSGSGKSVLIPVSGECPPLQSTNFSVNVWHCVHRCSRLLWRLVT